MKTKNRTVLKLNRKIKETDVKCLRLTHMIVHIPDLVQTVP